MPQADAGNSTRTTAEPPRLSPNLVFELLADERRRALVATLLDAYHEVAVEELVDALADGDAAETSIATTLHHVHLPKLEAADVIEWDDEFVDPTPLLDDLEPFLRAAADLENSIR